MGPALVRQRHWLWHGLHFPSLAYGVKFWGRPSDQRKFLFNILHITTIALHSFRARRVVRPTSLPDGSGPGSAETLVVARAALSLFGVWSQVLGPPFRS